MNEDISYKGIDLYDKTGVCASCCTKSNNMRLVRRGEAISYWCKRCSFSLKDSNITDITIGEIVLCFNDGRYEMGEVVGKVTENRWHHLSGEQDIYIVDLYNGESPEEINTLHIVRLAESKRGV